MSMSSSTGGAFTAYGFFTIEIAGMVVPNCFFATT